MFDLYAPMRSNTCHSGIISNLFCLLSIAYHQVMKISDADLHELMAIYQEEYGETLSLAEASEMAFRLVTLYTQIYSPLPGEQKKHVYDPCSG